jgi:hypothetical protein
MTRAPIVAALFATVVLTTGCADMSPTARRTVTGGAVGTAGGAIIGAMAGNAGLGAAAGAGAGLVGGFIYDRYQKSQGN